MDQGRVEIAVVLDRSGSMGVIREDTIGGMNTFIADQKKAGLDTRLTLAQFDDRYEVVHDRKHITEVPPLNSETFVPRGSTALLDAIGRTIDRLGARLAAMPDAERPTKVIFVIVTDGQENSSVEFRPERVKEMITHQREKYSWEFVFLGANQDAILSGQMLGISAGSSLTYAANAAGTKAAFRSVSSNTVLYSAGGAATMDFMEIDREAQAEALKDGQQ